MATKRERTQMEAIIRPEDLDELQELQRELQSRIDKAHNDGRAYLMAQYVVMMATVSTEIKKINARFERESLSASRRMLKDLKAELKAKKEGSGGGESSDE